jgi:hypothetical protein
VEPQKKYTIEGAITKFVTDFNYSVECKGYPIVAFQFVSLDKVHNGKMVWWNYLHEEVSDRYLKALNDFTGKNEDDKVVYTLINWEYDKASFWDSELSNENNSEVVQNFSHTFLPLGEPEEDKSGVERHSADPKEKSMLVAKWEEILIEKFNKSGYTMWISLPHKDVDGATIYSSVFCLFNKIVGKEYRLSIARKIRNFIIDHLIELYGHLYKLEIKAIKAGDNIDDYRFKPNFRGKIFKGDKTQIESHFEKLEGRYFTIEYLDQFNQVYTAALKRMEATYQNGVFVHGAQKYPKSYKPLTSITLDKSCKKHFFQFIYGRGLILAYHIIFNLTLSQSYSLLKNNGKKQLPIGNMGDFQKMFCIDGLHNDRYDTAGQLIPDNENLEELIPNLSEKEFGFLLSLCDKYNVLLKSRLLEAKSI